MFHCVVRIFRGIPEQDTLENNELLYLSSSEYTGHQKQGIIAFVPFSDKPTLFFDRSKKIDNSLLVGNWSGERTKILSVSKNRTEGRDNLINVVEKKIQQ